MKMRLVAHGEGVRSQESSIAGRDVRRSHRVVRIFDRFLVRLKTWQEGI